MQSHGRFPKIGVLLSGLVLLGGCHDAPVPGSAMGAPPLLEPARVARGAEVFRQSCATCHGDRAQGAINWTKAGPDGKYPPPPLDGSAHAWHHPFAQLKQTIQDGTLKLGGSMPPWKGKLSEADTEAVILWFQSTWPEPIYAAWIDIDQRSRAGGK